jgi:hypothetical protein
MNLQAPFVNYLYRARPLEVVELERVPDTTTFTGLGLKARFGLVMRPFSS